MNTKGTFVEHCSHLFYKSQVTNDLKRLLQTIHLCIFTHSLSGKPPLFSLLSPRDAFLGTEISVMQAGGRRRRGNEEAQNKEMRRASSVTSKANKTKIISPVHIAFCIMYVVIKCIFKSFFTKLSFYIELAEDT